MSSLEDSSYGVWYVVEGGSIYGNGVYGYNGVVRPVIVLPKSAL